MLCASYISVQIPDLGHDRKCQRKTRQVVADQQNEISINIRSDKNELTL